MRTRTTALQILLLTMGLTATAESMDKQNQGKPKAAPASTDSKEKKSGEEKEKPLTAAEKARLAAEEAAAEEARRNAVEKNIESIVNGLDVSSSQKSKVRALTTESQWKLAVSAFESSRGEEIHEHAHKIVPKTIPGLMQKFMPGYMRSKIMASRRKGRRGPPSRAEIAQIQKDARTKIEPQMRKTVMPALDKLMQERIQELHKNEKVMTRVIADRIIRINILGKDGSRQFATALEKAGYPATLTSGEDKVLNDRTAAMLKDLDLEKIVKAAGL